MTPGTGGTACFIRFLTFFPNPTVMHIPVPPDAANVQKLLTCESVDSPICSSLGTAVIFGSNRARLD